MARNVGEEIVILDVASGQFFALNDVGMLVWDKLEYDVSLEQLVEAVVAEFDVDRRDAEVDITAVTQQLLDAGLASP